MALILVLALAMGCLTGCGKDEGKQADGTGEEKYKVAIVTKMQDMYGALLSTVFQEEATRHPNITIDAFDYENDEGKFLTIMENVTEAGYDLVVSQSPKMDARNAIKNLQDAGGIFYHIAGSGYEYMYEEELARCLVCNEYEMGKVVAEQAAEDLPQNAKIVILLGLAGKQNTIDRNQGFLDVLKEKRPDIEVLDSQHADWNKDIAMKKMDDWQQAFDHIDGVLASNDAMASGAVESLLTAGFSDWDNMYIYGIDALTDACTYIQKGQMRASALQDATRFASQVLKEFDEFKAGTSDVINEHVLVKFDPHVINKDNVDEQMQYYKDFGLLK